MAIPQNEISNGDGMASSAGQSSQNGSFLGKFIADLASELSGLVRAETDLATMEMKQKAQEAGMGSASIVAGGLIAYGGFLMLMVALFAGIARFMPRWLAALLVGGVAAAGGGLLAANGVRRLKGIDPAPRRAMETLRANQEWVKSRVA